MAILGLALAAIITTIVVLSSGGPPSITGRHAFGSGTYQLVVAPALSADNHEITQAQARSALNHPDQYSRYARAPRLILFGFARVTALAVSGLVGAAHEYADEPAWVGVYEVPSSALLLKCETGRLAPPSTKPPDTYHFAIIIDPITGTQTFWNENASQFTQWVCSGRRF